jgi:Cu/Ag efflux protein CusF
MKKGVASASLARRGFSVLCMVLAASAAGCERRAKDGEAETASAVHRYRVRAEVVELTAPSSARREIGLRHEPIHDFVDQRGVVVGMDSMVMLLEVDPRLALDGISIGTKVEVLLAVDFQRNTYRLERLDRLPPETVLVFGKARPGVDSADR